MVLCNLIMPINSRVGFFIPALSSYLETKSIPYKDTLKQGEIDWNYPNDIHSPNQNPKGKIIIQRLLGERSANAYKTYELALRLLVSDSDESKLECLLYDWQDLIVNDFMFTLSETGITGLIANPFGATLNVNNLFLKIKLVQSSVVSQINQSKSGTGAVICVYQFTDFEPVNLY